MSEKLTRDHEQKAMLHIIFSTKYYDLDDFANLSGLNGIIVKIAKSKQNMFASDWPVVEAKVNANLTKFLEPLQ